MRGVAVVTGAAGAIGTALTATLTDAGYDVVGLDLPEACPPERLASGAMVGCDITDDAEVRAVFERIVADHGRIDLLVNNAGISAIGAFDDHDVETHRQVLAVNHLGSVSCTQAALPALRQSRGHVVVVSSVAGFAPVVGRPAAWHVRRLAPGLYERLMTRRMTATEGADRG